MNKDEQEWTRMNKNKQEKTRIAVKNAEKKSYRARASSKPTAKQKLFLAAVYCTCYSYLLVRFCNKNYQERTKIDKNIHKWTKMDENEQKCTKIGENEKNKQERTIKNMDKKKHD